MNKKSLVFGLAALMLLSSSACKNQAAETPAQDAPAAVIDQAAAQNAPAAEAQATDSADKGNADIKSNDKAKNDAKVEDNSTCAISKSWNVKVPCRLLKQKLSSADEKALPPMEIPFLKVKKGENLLERIEEFTHNQCVPKNSLKTSAGYTAQLFVCGFGTDSADLSEIESAIYRNISDLKLYISMTNNEQVARVFTVLDGSKLPEIHGDEFMMKVELTSAESVDFMGTKATLVKLHQNSVEIFDHDMGEAETTINIDASYLFVDEKTRFVTSWEDKRTEDFLDTTGCNPDDTKCVKKTHSEICKTAEFTNQSWNFAEISCSNAAKAGNGTASNVKLDQRISVSNPSLKWDNVKNQFALPALSGADLTITPEKTPAEFDALKSGKRTCSRYAQTASNANYTIGLIYCGYTDDAQLYIDDKGERISDPALVQKCEESALMNDCVLIEGGPLLHGPCSVKTNDECPKESILRGYSLEDPRGDAIGDNMHSDIYLSIARKGDSTVRYYNAMPRTFLYNITDNTSNEASLEIDKIEITEDAFLDTNALYVRIPKKLEYGAGDESVELSKTGNSYTTLVFAGDDLRLVATWEDAKQLKSCESIDGKKPKCKTENVTRSASYDGKSIKLKEKTKK